MVVEEIQNNPVTASQVFLSLALVVATIAYTYYTWLQVNEVREDRKIRNRPVIKGGLRALGGNTYTLYIRNTGNGAAHNLHVNLYFENERDESELIFKTPLFPSGNEQELEAPVSGHSINITKERIDSDFDDKSHEPVIVIESNYTDILGEGHTNTDRIELRDVLENQPSMQIVGDVAKIRKSIEKIENKL